MKTYSFLFLVLMFTGISWSQDTWVQQDSVNGPPRAVCGSFVINGEGYILGGLDDFGFRRKMYSYDPSNNDWDDEESIGGPNADGLDRGSASTFSIGDKGYICLGQGQTNAYFKDTWEYDAISGVWTQKADFMGSSRRQAVGFSIGDYGYVGTGQDVNGLCKDFYRFDPEANVWSQLGDFPGTARRQAVAFSMGDEAYLGTGDDGVLRKDFWMYVPSTDTWIQKADFPGTARAGATGWGIFPTGFIATGEDINFEYKKDVWEYNYFSNSWTQRTDFPGSGRKNAVSFVINGIAYLGTGFSGIFEDDFYAYTGIVGNEDMFGSSVRAFPNPTTEFLILESFSSLSNLNNVQVFNIAGRDVSEHIPKTTHGMNKVKLDVRYLPKGTYLVYYSGEPKQTKSCKFIVQ
jgi:N-acetylneuraminic acid mutarotase